MKVRVALLLASCFAIHAQTGPFIMGAGSLNPNVFRVAPGEVVTIFVGGAKTLLPIFGGVRPAYATGTPLPTSLAGFSARVEQGITRVYPASIFSVVQRAVCTQIDQGSSFIPLTPGCWVTELTVQIPYEVVPEPVRNPLPVVTRLIVREGELESTAIRIYPFADNIHIPGCRGLPTDLCSSFATHAGGEAISLAAPAKPGEVIVIYAVGLGATTPAVRTGDASPTPPATISASVGKVTAQLDFRVNAGPSRPFVDPSVDNPSQIEPLFVGLTPGGVGLYQINLKLPDQFPKVEPCGKTAPAGGTNFMSSYNTVYSNLTISIGTRTSFDGAPICVDPGQ